MQKGLFFEELIISRMTFVSEGICQSVFITLEQDNRCFNRRLEVCPRSERRNIKNVECIVLEAVVAKMAIGA